LLAVTASWLDGNVELHAGRGSRDRGARVKRRAKPARGPQLVFRPQDWSSPFGSGFYRDDRSEITDGLKHPVCRQQVDQNSCSNVDSDRGAKVALKRRTFQREPRRQRREDQTSAPQFALDVNSHK